MYCKIAKPASVVKNHTTVDMMVDGIRVCHRDRKILQDPREFTKRSF